MLSFDGVSFSFHPKDGKDDPMQTQNNSLFHFEGKPSLARSFPIALQHLLAMIIGNILPSLVLTNALKGTPFEVPPEQALAVIQGGMFIAALTTLLQLYPVWRFGARLPVVMGVSFAFIPILVETGLHYGYAAVYGAQIVGGVVGLLVGVLIGRIRPLFPPIVSGTVVLCIGLSLYPVAVNYLAGGEGSPSFGSWENWAVGLLTLVVVLLCSTYGKGLVKLAAILIGIGVGYGVSLLLHVTVLPGFVDFTNLSQATWLTAPKILPFGLAFPLGSVVSMGLMQVVNSIEAVGDTSSTTMGAFDREATDREISGSIEANALMSIVGAFIGALPTATYSQNVGIVSMTKVVARRVFVLVAGMLLIAGFVPKFGGLMMSIPQCVIGGATISVFAQITMNGIRLITSEELTVRNTTIVGLGVALGMGIIMAPQATEGLPEALKMIFTSGPVILATTVVFLLNLLLPKTTLEEERRIRERMEA